MKVYITGPITGVNQAQKIFDAAKLKIINQNMLPVSSMQWPIEKKSNWKLQMKFRIKQLMNCDAICLLPSWEVISRCRIEYETAKALGYQVLYLIESNDGNSYKLVNQ